MTDIFPHNYHINEFKRKKIHLFSFIIPLWYIFFPSSGFIFTSIILFLVLFIDLSRLYSNNASLNNFFNSNLLNTVRNYENKNLLSATYLIISLSLDLHI